MRNGNSETGFGRLRHGMVRSAPVARKGLARSSVPDRARGGATSWISKEGDREWQLMRQAVLKQKHLAASVGVPLVVKLES